MLKDKCQYWYVDRALSPLYWFLHARLYFSEIQRDHNILYIPYAKFSIQYYEISTFVSGEISSYLLELALFNTVWWRATSQVSMCQRVYPCDTSRERNPKKPWMIHTPQSQYSFGFTMWLSSISIASSSLILASPSDGSYISAMRSPLSLALPPFLPLHPDRLSLWMATPFSSHATPTYSRDTSLGPS